LAVISATGCSKKAPKSICKTSDDLAALKLLQSPNAANDARRDYARGDHRLLGINAGIGLAVPGLAGNPDESGYELRTIDSNDVSCSPQEHQIKIDAWNYVRIYNHQMMLLWQPSKNTSATSAPIARKPS
jgi:hypothetical protein